MRGVIRHIYFPGKSMEIKVLNSL